MEDTLLRLLTISEVAKVLRVPIPRAYGLARSGVIPTVRIGRQVRVAENALQAWIGQGGQALPGGWRKEPGPISAP